MGKIRAPHWESSWASSTGPSTRTHRHRHRHRHTHTHTCVCPQTLCLAVSRVHFPAVTHTCSEHPQTLAAPWAGAFLLTPPQGVVGLGTRWQARHSRPGTGTHKVTPGLRAFRRASGLDTHMDPSTQVLLLSHPCLLPAGSKMGGGLCLRGSATWDRVTGSAVAWCGRVPGGAGPGRKGTVVGGPLQGGRLAS